MIDRALSAITNELNDYLKRSFKIEGDQVVLGKLGSQLGSNDEGENKIICALVNVKEEEVVSPQSQFNKGNILQNKPIYLNLTLVFAANFSDYSSSLKFLSSVIGFFQSKQVFTSQNTPALSAGMVDKIMVETVNLDTTELSNLWSMMGAEYVPSIVYKLRVAAIDQQNILPEIATVDIVS